MSNPNDYCPNCSCESCRPINASHKEECEALQERNEELLKKVFRLENHIIALTKDEKTRLAGAGELVRGVN